MEPTVGLGDGSHHSVRKLFQHAAIQVLQHLHYQGENSRNISFWRQCDYVGRQQSFLKLSKELGR